MKDKKHKGVEENLDDLYDDYELYVHKHEFNDLLSIKIVDTKTIERIIKKEPFDHDSCWNI